MYRVAIQNFTSDSGKNFAMVYYHKENHPNDYIECVAKERFFTTPPVASASLCRATRNNWSKLQAQWRSGFCGIKSNWTCNKSPTIEDKGILTERYGIRGTQLLWFKSHQQYRQYTVWKEIASYSCTIRPTRFCARTTIIPVVYKWPSSVEINPDFLYDSILFVVAFNATSLKLKMKEAITWIFKWFKVIA